jgi:hypothetical protein
MPASFSRLADMDRVRMKFPHLVWGLVVLLADLAVNQDVRYPLPSIFEFVSLLASVRGGLFQLPVFVGPHSPELHRETSASGLRVAATCAAPDKTGSEDRLV